VSEIKKWCWRISTHLIACLVSGTAILIYDRFPFLDTACISQAHIVSQNSRGDQLEQSEEICDGFVHSFTVFINIIPARFGSKKTVFVYDLKNSVPKISWEDDNNIMIDIPDGLFFYRKVDKFQSIHINFKDNNNILSK
jgi:hypothetical protein